MKYIAQTFLLFAVVLLSCEVETEDQLIISTEDYTLEVSDNMLNGDTITELLGTSNQGSVTFEIISQTPSAVFSISDSDYGVLVVENEDLLDEMLTPQVILNVSVSKNGIVETSTVTINIINSGCQNVNPAILDVFNNVSFNASLGSVSPQDLGNGYTGVMDVSCGRLTVTGNDLLCGFCFDFLEDIDFQFSPSSDGITGEVKLFPEVFTYNDFIEIVGSTGTYNTDTKTIEVDFDIIDDLGPFTSKIVLTVIN